MRQKQILKNGLVCAGEHLECENYAADKQALIKVVSLKAGDYYFRDKTEHSALVFLLSGELELSMGYTINQKVIGGQMYLIPAGESYCSKTKTDTTVFYSLFDWEMPLCNKFAIRQLVKYKQNDCTDTDKTRLCLLRLHKVLKQEIESAIETLNTGLGCIHYQKLKRDIIFMELRGLYEKEQLAALFSPILGIDNDFKVKVLSAYTQTETVKELMDILHMSPTTFKRKFYQAFGTSAKHWLIQKKKERIFHDLIFTKTSVAELADKYKFSENYMTAFCCEHFGKSPRKIRFEWRSFIKG